MKLPSPGRQTVGDVSLTRQIARGGRIAAVCDLLDIRTLRVHGQVHRPPSGTCSVNVEVEPTYSREGDRLIYELAYNVSLDQESERVADLAAQYAVVFQVPVDFKAEGDEYESFGEVTAMMAVFPYLREFVQSTGARLGVSGLVLGLIRLPAAATLQSAALAQSPESKPLIPLAKKSAGKKKAAASQNSPKKR